eukprot:GHVS01005857.1.p1 GENE.GHVS01005857.1~~GHVS01005857.1.p1  ORF type:complete len:297 (-),score=30.43 GHVS01005857.1:67-957(-)
MQQEHPSKSSVPSSCTRDAAPFYDDFLRCCGACAQPRPTTHLDVLEFFQTRWIPTFGVPEHVVVDRGSVYTAAVQKYLREDLGVKLGFSSPGYPQGNSINETFPVLLGEATMAYNAAPNASLGDSPYRRLLGMESRLPGLAWLPLPTEEGRQQLQAEGRVQQALRVAIESQSALHLHPASHLHKGDNVVYFLTDYQRRRGALTSGHHQYSSSWSLPQLVIDISGGRAIVRPLHDRRAPVRMVPLRLCRRYGPSVQRGQEGPGSPDVEEEGEEPMGRASHEAVDEPPRSRRRTSERR